MKVPAWKDVSRCPLSNGDLVRVDARLGILVGTNTDSELVIWLVTHHKGIESITWHIRAPRETVFSYERPFENSTVRHRLERAVRSVQRTWRFRRLSRALKRFVKHHLPGGVCDLIAGCAVCLQ